MESHKEKSRRASKKPHSRVFIIGAGFSVAAGVPVLNTILKSLLTFAERPDYIKATEDFPLKEGEARIPPKSLLEYCIDQYREMRQSTDTDLPNLEDLATCLDEFQEMQELLGSYDLLWIVEGGFRPLNDVLSEYLWSFTKDSEPNSVISDFCAQLTPYDTIISLNWDNIIERHLFLCGERFETLIDRNPGDDKEDFPQHYVRLLKLHGSIDWRDANEDDELFNHVGEARRKGWEIFLPQAYPGGRPIYWSRPQRTAQGARIRLPLETGTFDHCWTRTLGDPIIIYPTTTKRFSDAYIWDQWLHAARAIESVNEIIVIGYSLPAADRQVIQLIRHGIMNRDEDNSVKVKVVNPDHGVTERLKKTDPSAQHCADSLQEWLK